MTVDTETTPHAGPCRGEVYLVGAGPGDPDLLTLRALKLMARAEVVIYDRLVGDEILEMVPAAAERVFVGKMRDRHVMPQPRINALMVARAWAGLRVLRLKGGDPFVFGRGGEEALALVAAGVPFRIVPGVTAGIGGLAYAGIPVTHRDVNSAVTFVTGHDAMGEVPGGLDWSAIARSPVIVLYMALKQLDPIARILIEAGRPPNEPTAIVSRASTTAQRVIEVPLSGLAAAVGGAAVEAPAVVVIGDVVRLRAGLDWVGALAGRVLAADPLGAGGRARTA